MALARLLAVQKKRIFKKWWQSMAVGKAGTAQRLSPPLWWGQRACPPPERGHWARPTRFGFVVKPQSLKKEKGGAGCH